MSEQSRDICFVISPIGKKDTPTRKHVDNVFRYIIEPALPDAYEPLRADHISESGMITRQVIEHVLNDPLVIADLSEHNANVFYELAIRHAARKPFIQIMDEKWKPIPFDVAGIRTILYDISDPGSVDECRKHIMSFIQASQKKPAGIDNPIFAALALAFALNSEAIAVRTEAERIAMLGEIRDELSSEIYDMVRDIRANLYTSQSTLSFILQGLGGEARSQVLGNLASSESTLSSLLQGIAGDARGIVLGGLASTQSNLSSALEGMLPDVQTRLDTILWRFATEMDAIAREVRSRSQQR